MSDTEQSDKLTGPEPADSNAPSVEVPFGSNEIRLTALQWVSVAVIVPAVLAVIPRWWAHAEPLDAGPDYRIPFSRSEDYWLYERRVTQAVSQQQVVVVGDSVIWGEYVETDQTLSHDLNEQTGTTRFANGGLNGAHPLALSGLVQDYATSLHGTRVIVDVNLLWMSSPERDLQVEKQIPFNHPDLVPQFSPRIPSYKATVTDRIGVVIDRSLTFRGCARHLRIAAFDGQDLPRWTIEHPWSNPVEQALTPPAAEEQPRPEPVPWVERGIRQQDLPWIDLETSLQWHAVETLIRCLESRNNSAFVVVSPLNEHLLTDASRERYQALVNDVVRRLSQQGVAHAVPPVLPSDEYADASHPLAAGYARLAGALAADPEFQQWLNGSR